MMPEVMIAPVQAGRRLRAGWLLAGLFGWLVVDDLLLLRFLGLSNSLPAIAGAAAGLALCAALVRSADAPVPLRRLAVCLAIGFVLVLIGGEGRILYANPDWQVRDAVLADMVRLPWPFAYVGHGEPLLLRAPTGMYLLPALIGKLLGRAAADWALAGQNGIALGVLLALGSLLADDARGQRILAVVAIGFGGLDTIGAALVKPARLWPLTANIENWGPTILPSPLSSLFWTPQHAIAGFAGALLVLLWRSGKVLAWVPVAAIPLLALWSPLAAIGTLPFAGFAMLRTWTWQGRRPPTMADIGWPALALVPAVVPLVYLAADAGRVGARFAPLPPLVYLVFEAIEVLPFALAAVLAGRGWVDRPVLGLATAMLMLTPLVEVGESVDFAMRASIPALAILSVAAAQAIARAPAGHWRTVLIVLLCIGALTPARDVARAFAFRPPPPPGCDFWRAWDQGFAGFGKETYLARLSHLPAAIRPAAPTQAAPLAPRSCWSRAWTVDRFRSGFTNPLSISATVRTGLR